MRYSAKLGRAFHGRYNPLTSTISVAVAISATRREFTIAHELMHALAPLGIPAEHLESWCDRGAAALMMPARAFLESGTACAWDLETLREWWPHCSWNALVRRIADLVPGTAASAWHRQQLRFRETHSGVDLPEHADQLEEFVACEAMHGTGRSELTLGGLDVRAWKSGPGRAVTVVRRVHCLPASGVSA